MPQAATKVAKNDVGVAIIVFGDLTEYGIVNQETVNNCKRALDAFIFSAKPVNHFSGRKITHQQMDCPVVVLAMSRSRNQGEREKVTGKIKEHLIRVYGLPDDCIIELSGRNFKDITDTLKERKFSGNVLVAGRKFSFLGHARLTHTLKANGLQSPRYLGVAHPSFVPAFPF